MIQENDLRITIFPFIQKVFAIPSLTMGSFNTGVFFKNHKILSFPSYNTKLICFQTCPFNMPNGYFFFNIFSFGFMFLPDEHSISLQWQHIKIFHGRTVIFSALGQSDAPCGSKEAGLGYNSQQILYPTHVVQFRKEQATHFQ